MFFFNLEPKVIGDLADSTLLLQIDMLGMLAGLTSSIVHKATEQFIHVNWLSNNYQ